MNVIKNQEHLKNELKVKRICRFCLCQNNKLNNIYTFDTPSKLSAPLPIQIMAITSIEVFPNDGMPPFICTECIQYFENSYQFKQMCKKADYQLRQVPLMGVWPQELVKPQNPHSSHSPQPNANPNAKANVNVNVNSNANTNLINNKKKPETTLVNQPKVLNNVQCLPNSEAPEKKTPNKETSLLVTKIKTEPNHTKNSNIKILNTESSPKKQEPSSTVRSKTDIIRMKDDATVNILNKIENDDELLLDDVQRLIESEIAEEAEFPNISPKSAANNSKKAETNSIVNGKPKLLNKASVRILNKEANKDVEPRLSLPKVKHDEDGNVAITAEILDVDEPYENEPDPKDAAPVEINVFPCPLCERSFPLRQLRDIHVENHKRERNFHCETCGKSFLSKYDLQKHVITHNGEKPFKCSACDKSFTRSTLLHRHEKSHTDMPKYICIHCEKPFLSQQDMEKHAERHNKYRPFKCKLCKKSFAFKQGLERHEVVHSRQQPHPCQYCDQSFSTTSKLARHLTAHAGERPYPCKFCSKSYLLSHHFTRHLRSHKNVGNTTVPFMCTHCNQICDSLDALVKHSATHVEESLVCPICKEALDNQEDAANHIQQHLLGEAYACEFCDLVFMSADKLSAHSKAEHKEDMLAYYEDEKRQAEKKIIKQELQQMQQEQTRTENDGNMQTRKRIKRNFVIDNLDSIQVKNEVLSDTATDADSQLNDAIRPHNSKLNTTENQQDEQQIKKRRTEPLLTKPTATYAKSQRSMCTRQSAAAATSTTEASILQTQKTSLSGLPEITIRKIKPTETKKQGLQNANEKPTNKSPNKKTPSPRKTPSKSEPLTANTSGNNAISIANKIGSSAGSFNLITDDRKLTIHKIRVTKKQAKALAKEGRIQYKDGNMILINHTNINRN